MSRFKALDDRLEVIAKILDAQLTKDRPGYPEALRTFEERRIDWQENKIRKAIIIQPTFKVEGILDLWNFINIAWIDVEGIKTKRAWRKNLLDQVGFREIEKKIDSLLL